MLPHFRHDIREYIEHERTLDDFYIRPMLVRDIAYLESALDKLHRKEALGDEELEMLALEADPRSPDGKRFKQDVAGEVREFFKVHERLMADVRVTPEEDKIDADAVAVASQLAHGIKHIAILFEQERAQGLDLAARSHP